MHHKPELRLLAHKARILADFAAAAHEGRLDDPAALHGAMREYRAVERAYLGLPTASDFIRADAERYDDADTRGALERVAQLLEREIDT